MIIFLKHKQPNISGIKLGRFHYQNVKNMFSILNLTTTCKYCSKDIKMNVGRNCCFQKVSSTCVKCEKDENTKFKMYDLQ
jgi:hypothetical protein